MATVATQPSGSGTELDPYLISNLGELRWVSETSSSWSSWFLQTADIDVSESATWNGGEGWSPIGWSLQFGGRYDGGGHTVSNLYINRPTHGSTGLFGSTNGASIKKLGVLNASVVGDINVGVVVGKASSTQIIECYATGTISGETRVGGIFGEGWYAVVSNCYCDVGVSGNTAGGLGGELAFAVAVVENCYSLGSASSAGLIANNYQASVISSYWDTETSGQSTSAGGVGKTTAEMQTQSTFIGWDFTDTWVMGESGYPELQWSQADAPPSDTNATITFGAVEYRVQIDQPIKTEYSLGMLSATEASGLLIWRDKGIDYDHCTTTLKFSVYDEAEESRKPIQEWLTGIQWSSDSALLKVDDGVYPLSPLYDFTENVAIGMSGVNLERSSDQLNRWDSYKATIDPLLLSDVPVYAPPNVVSGVSTSNTVATQPSGSGTELDPYLISNLGELRWVSETSSSWDKWFLQTADIDASETSTWNGGEGWSPIGTESPYISFRGVYSGGGYSITGITLVRATNNNGFFGQTSSARVQDFRLVGVSITGRSNIGGLVGRSRKSDYIKCSVSGVVAGWSIVGGFVGFDINGVPDTSFFKQCISTVTVSSTTTSNDSNIGGFIGYSSKYAYFGNCCATGAVDGGNGGHEIGGFAGVSSESTFENCYAISPVTPSSATTGGFLGKELASNTITSTYWGTETSGQSTSAGGVGKTTAEMQTQSTFTGWDFTDIWTMGASGYPELQWAIPDSECTDSTTWDIMGVTLPEPTFDHKIQSVFENRKLMIGMDSYSRPINHNAEITKVKVKCSFSKAREFLTAIRTTRNSEFTANIPVPYLPFGSQYSDITSFTCSLASDRVILNQRKYDDIEIEFIIQKRS